MYNNKILPNYGDFFYDYYIEEISENAGLKVPKKELYLKYLYQTNYEKLDWFMLMKEKEKDKNYIRDKKIIVYESIHMYLQLIECLYKKYKNKFIEKINNKLQGQNNKEYMCYMNGIFYYDSLEKDEITVLDIKGLKKIEMDIIQVLFYQLNVIKQIYTCY